MRKTMLALATLATMAAQPAHAQDYTVGSIKISGPWTRVPPAASKVAGGFMSITNTGKEPDRLIGGTALVAGRFEVHEMVMDGGIMKMSELKQGLEIKPGQTVVLKPGSYHVMLMDLKQPMKEGEPIKGTLVFQKAGTVEIAYKVAPFGAKEPGEAATGGGHKGMKH